MPSLPKIRIYIINHNNWISTHSSVNMVHGLKIQLAHVVSMEAVCRRRCQSASETKKACSDGVPPPPTRATCMYNTFTNFMAGIWSSQLDFIACSYQHTRNFKTEICHLHIWRAPTLALEERTCRQRRAPTRVAIPCSFKEPQKQTWNIYILEKSLLA